VKAQLRGERRSSGAFVWALTWGGTAYYEFSSWHHAWTFIWNVKL
jgi:hypothetical protein